MSCDLLTKGRVEACKDSVGGLAAVYFLPYDTVVRDQITYDGTDTDVITFLGEAPPIDIYKYELKARQTHSNKRLILVEILELPTMSK